MEPIGSFLLDSASVNVVGVRGICCSFSLFHLLIFRFSWKWSDMLIWPQRSLMHGHFVWKLDYITCYPAYWVLGTHWTRSLLGALISRLQWYHIFGFLSLILRWHKCCISWVVILFVFLILVYNSSSVSFLLSFLLRLVSNLLLRICNCCDKRRKRTNKHCCRPFAKNVWLFG